MNTMILYRSKSHGNTKRLVDAICAAHPEVACLDVSTVGKEEKVDLSAYRLIGLASGVYYGNMDSTLMRVASKSLRDGDYVFGLVTRGSNDQKFSKNLGDTCLLRAANLIGIYDVFGYNTMFPFKLVGGLMKGHPTQEEVDGAVAFYEGLVETYGASIEAGHAKRAARDAYLEEHPIPSIWKALSMQVKRLAGRDEDASK